MIADLGRESENAEPTPATCDLLVAGAGGAGLTAALVASVAGLKPLICEASSRIGGTTARSSGGIWAPGSPHMMRDGYCDDASSARRYADLCAGRADETGMRDAYFDLILETVSFLEAHTTLKFQPLPHPDYHEADGAAPGGRSLASNPFDGRLLGRQGFRRLAEPLETLMAPGGMMIGRADIPHLLNPLQSLTAMRRATSLLVRLLRDRLNFPRGTNLLMGNALVAHLLYALEQRGVPILTDTRVVRLESDRGRVNGAWVESRAGQARITARLGVILATGGFSHAAKWRTALFDGREQAAHSLACEHSRGDGLDMAEGLGAKIQREGLTNGAVWAPVSVLTTGGRTRYFPHFFLDRPKPGIIAVARDGNRFVNEAQSYHDFVAGMLKSDTAMSRLPVYLVCDFRALKAYGLGLIMPGARGLRRLRAAGYITVAPSIDALAKKLGIAAEALQRTVEANNRFAAEGQDRQFAKGQSNFNRFHGDAAHRPNPCLGPIEEPPFVAVALWPADLSTFAGLAANENCEVLDAQGQPIEGLYACGNDLRTVWGGAAPGPGITLGPALAFAFRAARHVVESQAALPEDALHEHQAKTGTS